MKLALTCNICRTGRLVRGAIALALVIAAGLALTYSLWLAIVLALLGCFSLFEALRGWCMLRACGVKTRL